MALQKIIVVDPAGKQLILDVSSRNNDSSSLVLNRLLEIDKQTGCETSGARVVGKYKKKEAVMEQKKPFNFADAILIAAISMMAVVFIINTFKH